MTLGDAIYQSVELIVGVVLILLVAAFFLGAFDKGN